jgi:hypothetical protein
MVFQHLLTLVRPMRTSALHLLWRRRHLVVAAAVVDIGVSANHVLKVGESTGPKGGSGGGGTITLASPYTERDKVNPILPPW